MTRHSNLAQVCIALALLFFVTAAEAGLVDSFKQSWSEIGGKSSSKKSSVDSKKMNTGATGCMEAVLEAKARGGSGVDVTAACAQGANKSIKDAEEQEAREEQELLARKDAETWGRRIDHVNERIIDRQPRIERINAEKSGDAPVKDESEIVMDKKCRADASCREVVIAAESEASNPGLLARGWYFLFPGSAPKAKAELKGIERDVAFLSRSIDEIKTGIEETEESLYTATSVKQKSSIARDKGVLISQLSQATQALAVLKTQQGELDKGYFAYVLMLFAAIGGTIVKKISDGAISFSLDGAKHIVGKVRRRRRKDEPENQHSMY